MANTDTSDPAAEDSVQRLAEMHAHMVRATRPIQRLANYLTRTLGRPVVVASILAAILCWIAGNQAAAHVGAAVIEQFPFPMLELFATVSALMVALLILTTQRHEEEIATRRAQLTLQIAVLSEKKIAKIIELLEEQRRDNPMLLERTDHEAAAMAQASDPRTSLDQIAEALGT